MADVDELLFSTEALKSRLDFYDGLNDINIFVEDSDSQYLYEEIFQRLLGKAYSIKTIFPCGGKQAVIDTYIERGSHTDGVRNVYLVDGDFDRLLFPENMIVHPQFVYLKRYNIESYLINETGLCKLVKGKLKCIYDVAHAKLKYADWFQRIIGEAKELFLCYCYIQKANLGIPNVNRNHYDFLDQKTGFKRNDGKFESFRNELYEKYPEAQEQIENIRADFEKLYGNHYEILICGKFLLSSLHDYLHTIIGRPTPKDDLIWCLVETFDVNQLDYVRAACLNTVTS